jgi:hypothetical protein
MTTPDSEINDDLRDEYDLTQLRVRKRGAARMAGKMPVSGIEVHLDPDVAAVFPNALAVNEALRFLIRVTQQKPA